MNIVNIKLLALRLAQTGLHQSAATIISDLLEDGHFSAPEIMADAYTLRCLNGACDRHWSSSRQ